MKPSGIAPKGEKTKNRHALIAVGEYGACRLLSAIKTNVGLFYPDIEEKEKILNLIEELKKLLGHIETQI